MGSTLTKSRKQLLQLLVGKVTEEGWDADDIRLIPTTQGMLVASGTAKKEVNSIKRVTVDALAAEGYLYSRWDAVGRCEIALTPKAFDAVDRNFAPSASAFLHPLAVPDHLHPEIRKRCLPADDTPQAWDSAVRTALTILEERMRSILGAENENWSGAGLVDRLFGKSGPWEAQLGRQRAQALRDLFSGMIRVYRNQYGHRLVDPAPEDGGAIIQFVSLLLKLLDDECGDQVIYRGGDGQWRTKRLAASRPSSRHDTQKDAIAAATAKLRKHGGGTLIIHGADGRIRSKNTFGPRNDPNPPRDRHHSDKGKWTTLHDRAGNDPHPPRD